jgi:hypothetical protein
MRRQNRFILHTGAIHGVTPKEAIGSAGDQNGMVRVMPEYSGVLSAENLKLQYTPSAMNALPSLPRRGCLLHDELTNLTRANWHGDSLLIHREIRNSRADNGLDRMPQIACQSCIPRNRRMNRIGTRVRFPPPPLLTCGVRRRLATITLVTARVFRWLCKHFASDRT